MYSEGIEFKLGIEKENDSIDGSIVWSHETKCPHCNKTISIYKWLENWKKIILNKIKESENGYNKLTKEEECDTCPRRDYPIEEYCQGCQMEEYRKGKENE